MKGTSYRSLKTLNRMFTMSTKQIKHLLDLFEQAVERRTEVYQLADDENDENQAAVDCSAAKAELIKAIESCILQQSTSD